MFIGRVIAIVFAVAGSVLTAQAEDAGRLQPQNNSHGGILGLLPPDSVSRHVLKTVSRELVYTATAGTMDLYGADGKIAAKVYYTAYIAQDTAPNRPLTFAFNGGPGAASAYLHLGLVGPKVLEFGPGDNGGTTPSVKDNPESWLDFTDLVLIDPVGTGWSRAASDGDNAKYFGVKQDAESLAKVIALYVQKNQRIESAKYLLGESYGGFRAAKVAAALKDSQGILVSGIVMVSPLIDSRLIFGATDYPLGAALQFPSLAAAEMERTNRFDERAVEDAEQFAMTDYLVALAGPSLVGNAAASFYGKVSGMTGVSLRDVERTRGFVDNVYAKSAKSASGDIVSPYDAAVAAPDPYPEGNWQRGGDPVLDGFTRAYGSAFVSYARTDLGFACDMTYSLLNTDVNRRWEWDGNRADASADDDIRDLLSTIPSFRLLVSHGYSDVLTPYGASKYVLDHLPPRLAQGRTRLTLYRGGHMFYTRGDSRRKMTEDARAFFAGGGDGN
ncbi:carboxypeptidase [Rhizobium sp. KVB221]|uniref:Carboxypeptidase n=1 Tax=Rhizobium setariae TaxID=2801340 RepID=A0A937CR36_9HYPH|nr:carboxypeptidase [Rhizobium setariae]MBL0373867.1 carboxypeptidase [Rhizobium setariae]